MTHRSGARALRPGLVVALSALGMLCLASCAENAASTSGPAGATDNSLVAPQANAGGSRANADRTVVASAAQRGGDSTGSIPGLTSLLPIRAEKPAVLAAPVPPAGAQWTMLVYTLRGPTHVAESEEMKRTLLAKTKRPGWYLIHGRDESNLYFGYYTVIDDAANPATAAAKRDLEMVRHIPMNDTDGQVVKDAFSSAVFVPLSAPDPAAPPEWNLFNKDRAKAPDDPTRAYWSLQIMAFKGNELRKEAAVDAVRALRKLGVEAYYYHGPSVSSVCVGSWKRTAIQQQDDDGSQPIGSPDDTIILYQGDLPQGAHPREFDDEGHRIVAVAPVLKILDKSMKEMIANHPWHAVNYMIRTIKGTDGQEHKAPSFLVVIPRAKGDGFYDSHDVVPPTDGMAGSDGSGITSMADSPAKAPPEPGLGRLRHIGQ